jgi:hypothetical protein
MTYVLIGLLFVVVVGGLLLALTMRATAGSTPASPEPGDETAVGDTPHHSGAEEGGPSQPGPVEPDSGRFKRDPIGGEAEAETTIETR